MTWVRPGGLPAEVLVRERTWRLRSRPADAAAGQGDATFVGRRQQHELCRFRAVVSTPRDTIGGISLRVDPRHQLSLEVEGDEVRAVIEVGPARTILRRSVISCGDDVTLELRTVPATGEVYSTSRGPDRIVAAVVRADTTLDLAEIDGRYLSTELAGGFTGRLVGIWCARGEMIVSSACYHGTPDTDPSD